MYRSVSVRIEGVLAAREREEISRTITSLGGRVVSLNVLPNSHRTYGLFALPGGYDASALARGVGACRVDDPALVVLEIFPENRSFLDPLTHALGGAGRPIGITDATRTENGLLLELDAARTPLSLLIDLVDTELEYARGRRIVSLLPLDDAVLTSAARDLLGDPAIDVSRLIETYTESLS
jgi:hypothetical protein